MPKMMTIAARVGPGIVIATIPKRIATRPRRARAHQLPVHTSTSAGAVMGLSPYLTTRSGGRAESESIDADDFAGVIVAHDLYALDEAIGLFHRPDFLRLDNAVVASLNLELDRFFLRIVGDTSKLGALHGELITPIRRQDLDISGVGGFAQQEVFGERLEVFLELVDGNLHRFHFVTLSW